MSNVDNSSSLLLKGFYFFLLTKNHGVANAIYIYVICVLNTDLLTTPISEVKDLLIVYLNN